jgi:hypothetical protein
MTTIVQNSSVLTTFGTSHTVTLTGAVTTGNTLMFGVFATGSATITVTGSFSAATADFSTSTTIAGTATYYSKQNVSGAPTTITFTTSASCQLAVFWFELLGTVNYDTGSGTSLNQSSAATSPQPITVTTSSAADFILHMQYNGAAKAPTYDAGYSSVSLNSGFTLGEWIASSGISGANTIGITWTGGSQTVTQVGAAYKAAGGSFFQSLALLGVGS